MVKNSIRNKCLICGNIKNNLYIPLCSECYPPMYKKGSYPHQKLRKRKIWKEKRLQKLNKVGNKCECCDKPKQSLSIHHPKEINSFTYEQIWDKILVKRLNSFLNEDDKRLQYANAYLQFKHKKGLLKSKKYYKEKAKNESVRCCPKCNGTNYITRKSMAPKYKCNNCKSEFSRLKTRAQLSTLEKIRSLDNLINDGKEISPKVTNTLINVRNIVLSGFIQKLIPIFFEDLRIQYEEKIQRLLTNYLDFDKTIVLCKGCHIATSRGLILCTICKDGFHTAKYDRCSNCREKHIEETDPTAKMVHKFFNLSPSEHFERSMESECLICGSHTYEQIQQYVVYLNEQDIYSEDFVGDVCEKCFLEYKESEEKEYFVKEL